MQPWQIALLRAVLGGIVLGGSAFFGGLAAGQSIKVAGIQAGVAFFGYLILRGGGEGLIDQAAANAGPPAVAK